MSSPVTSPAAERPEGERVGAGPGFPVVAVVGGGQLARMLQPAAVELGVGLRVLATGVGESAALVVPDVHLGAHTDLDALRSAAAGAAALTFDHEHVPTAHLRTLAAEGVAVRPGPDALVHAQDKLVMRRRLTDLGVPCPRWAAVADADALARFGEDVGWPVVLKTPRGGYDGKGVRVLADAAAAHGVQDWFDATDGPLLAEERVAFVRELAVLVARSPSGQAAAWPVVETVQTAGVCSEVTAPAPDLDEDVAARAVDVALRVAGELGTTGVLAVECFETPDGQVLVNELAMRPHNSGHWTQDGATTSQFEQHLRAVLDLPLGSTRARAPWTVMVNVLGSSRPDRAAEDPAQMYRSYLHVMARDPGVKVHLYGKSPRPGRKLGHVTAWGDDLDDVRARARHAAAFVAGEVDE
ncbi:5-(carboxyamino)imidazole ribonucleotide synthase [Pseudokineococcus basanitobsidens]|uniref:N5-carboxyaminoimidazole ribonucleotide synthase n=1 Tax=Pseudokineococcus basanitobsidens TaxID=1926649 RepID=A0ABU8RL82_9ACTN